MYEMVNGCLMQVPVWLYRCGTCVSEASIRNKNDMQECD
ncbi:hypothetical protein T01_9372 [Trichinella spiralis]|uniref:Uncharacterized protein n=1 Tax=Trichinella spiralis TaxID=6334 RepID=A0A0V0ZRH9_TRISP|nr:hypothetical protein T01_9372 [Trichinella spiralis]